MTLDTEDRIGLLEKEVSRLNEVEPKALKYFQAAVSLAMATSAVIITINFFDGNNADRELERLREEISFMRMEVERAKGHSLPTHVQLEQPTGYETEEKYPLRVSVHYDNHEIDGSHETKYTVRATLYLGLVSAETTILRGFQYQLSGKLAEFSEGRMHPGFRDILTKNANKPSDDQTDEDKYLSRMNSAGYSATGGEENQRTLVKDTKTHRSISTDQSQLTCDEALELQETLVREINAETGIKQKIRLVLDSGPAPRKHEISIKATVDKANWIERLGCPEKNN
ncbi:hypothetical protein SAMN04488030_1749 [Aliiroseovarius halocynthiae]|uniref:Uncharacterized protein n=1 Tax=Aliiroseovarius halocynthiae TaxID=985055 RepID=A0A545SSG3_9RHOB|nr:hypothetical protein [Aliiroseovarius halocynthiae]TQV67903.1 hypothetical protein FIL88_08655 [Aliiroseovarius halocynthiae]SMR73000.1 hypothetical protein SAMN04488030_1749 [Aliiroseovarius halocynthiae]